MTEKLKVSGSVIVIHFYSSPYVTEKVRVRAPWMPAWYFYSSPYVTEKGGFAACRRHSPISIHPRSRRGRRPPHDKRLCRHISIHPRARRGRKSSSRVQLRYHFYSSPCTTGKSLSAQLLYAIIFLFVPVHDGEDIVAIRS